MNELATKIENGNLLPNTLQPATTDLDTFKEVAASQQFVPYIQLLGSNSRIVKQGKFPMGHFGLGLDQKLNDLGDEFICLPVAWRSKAVRFDPLMMVYDTEDPDFQALKEEAGKKDSGCVYGPEFLLWLPDFSTLATYLLGSKTGRREAKNVYTFLGHACKMRSHYIEDKRTGYSWHGMKVDAFGGDIALPEWESVMPQIESFKNPEKYVDVKEVAEEETRER